MELAAKNIFSLYHKAFKTMNLDLLSDSVCYSTKALVLNVEELQVVSESMISSSLKKKNEYNHASRANLFIIQNEI